MTEGSNGNVVKFVPSLVSWLNLLLLFAHFKTLVSGDGVLARCPIGLAPPDCTKKCRAGSFGINCASACSSTCHGKSCRPDSGICYKCRVGFRGPMCTQKCQEGFYGPDCKLLCPVKCLHQICDPFSGLCEKCTPGYAGAECHKRATSGDVDEISAKEFQATRVQADKKDDIGAQSLKYGIVILVAFSIPACIVIVTALYVKRTLKQRRLASRLSTTDMPKYRWRRQSSVHQVRHPRGMQWSDNIRGDLKGIQSAPVTGKAKSEGVSDDSHGNRMWRSNVVYRHSRPKHGGSVHNEHNIGYHSTTGTPLQPDLLDTPRKTLRAAEGQAGHSSGIKMSQNLNAGDELEFATPKLEKILARNKPLRLSNAANYSRDLFFKTLPPGTASKFGLLHSKVEKSEDRAVQTSEMSNISCRRQKSDKILELDVKKLVPDLRTESYNDSNDVPSETGLPSQTWRTSSNAASRKSSGDIFIICRPGSENMSRTNNFWRHLLKLTKSHHRETDTEKDETDAGPRQKVRRTGRNSDRACRYHGKPSRRRTNTRERKRCDGALQDPPVSPDDHSSRTPNRSMAFISGESDALNVIDETKSQVYGDTTLSLISPASQMYRKATQPPPPPEFQIHGKTTLHLSPPEFQAYRKSPQTLPPSEFQVHGKTTELLSPPEFQVYGKTTQPLSPPELHRYRKTTQLLPPPKLQVGGKTNQPPAKLQKNSETTQPLPPPDPQEYRKTTQFLPPPELQMYRRATQPLSPPESQVYRETTQPVTPPELDKSNRQPSLTRFKESFNLKKVFCQALGVLSRRKHQCLENSLASHDLRAVDSENTSTSMAKSEPSGLGSLGQDVFHVERDATDANKAECMDKELNDCSMNLLLTERTEKCGINTRTCGQTAVYNPGNHAESLVMSTVCPATSVQNPFIYETCGNFENIFIGSPRLEWGHSKKGEFAIQDMGDIEYIDETTNVFRTNLESTGFANETVQVFQANMGMSGYVDRTKEILHTYINSTGCVGEEVFHTDACCAKYVDDSKQVFRTNLSPTDCFQERDCVSQTTDLDHDENESWPHISNAFTDVFTNVSHLEPPAAGQNIAVIKGLVDCQPDICCASSSSSNADNTRNNKSPLPVVKAGSSTISGLPKIFDMRLKHRTRHGNVSDARAFPPWTFSHNPLTPVPLYNVKNMKQRRMQRRPSSSNDIFVKIALAVPKSNSRQAQYFFGNARVYDRHLLHRKLRKLTHPETIDMVDTQLMTTSLPKLNTRQSSLHGMGEKTKEVAKGEPRREKSITLSTQSNETTSFSTKPESSEDLQASSEQSKSVAAQSTNAKAVKKTKHTCAKEIKPTTKSHGKRSCLKATGSQEGQSRKCHDELEKPKHRYVNSKNLSQTLALQNENLRRRTSPRDKHLPHDVNTIKLTLKRAHGSDRCPGYEFSTLLTTDEAPAVHTRSQDDTVLHSGKKQKPRADDKSPPSASTTPHKTKPTDSSQDLPKSEFTESSMSNKSTASSSMKNPPATICSKKDHAPSKGVTHKANDSGEKQGHGIRQISARQQTQSAESKIPMKSHQRVGPVCSSAEESETESKTNISSKDMRQNTECESDTTKAHTISEQVGEHVYSKKTVDMTRREVADQSDGDSREFTTGGSKMDGQFRRDRQSPTSVQKEIRKVSRLYTRDESNSESLDNSFDNTCVTQDISEENAHFSLKNDKCNVKQSSQKNYDERYNNPQDQSESEMTWSSGYSKSCPPSDLRGQHQKEHHAEAPGRTDKDTVKLHNAEGEFSASSGGKGSPATYSSLGEKLSRNVGFGETQLMDQSGWTSKPPCTVQRTGRERRSFHKSFRNSEKIKDLPSAKEGAGMCKRVIKKVHRNIHGSISDENIYLEASSSLDAILKPKGKAVTETEREPADRGKTYLFPGRACNLLELVTKPSLMDSEAQTEESGDNISVPKTDPARHGQDNKSKDLSPVHKPSPTSQEFKDSPSTDKGDKEDKSVAEQVGNLMDILTADNESVSDKVNLKSSPHSSDNSFESPLHVSACLDISFKKWDCVSRAGAYPLPSLLEKCTFQDPLQGSSRGSISRECTDEERIVKEDEPEQSQCRSLENASCPGPHDNVAPALSASLRKSLSSSEYERQSAQYKYSNWNYGFGATAVMFPQSAFGSREPAKIESKEFQSVAEDDSECFYDALESLDLATGQPEQKAGQAKSEARKLLRKRKHFPVPYDAKCQESKHDEHEKIQTSKQSGDLRLVFNLKQTHLRSSASKNSNISRQLPDGKHIAKGKCKKTPKITLRFAKQNKQMSHEVSTREDVACHSKQSNKSAASKCSQKKGDESQMSSLTSDTQSLALSFETPTAYRTASTPRPLLAESGPVTSTGERKVKYARQQISHTSASTAMTSLKDDIASNALNSSNDDIFQSIQES